MANTTTTPNMNLVVPIVGLEPGPQWATDLNNCMSRIDTHDHSSGNGVLITPSGLNITSDLTYNNNDATGLRTARFTQPSTTVLGASDLAAVYVQGVDLYYVDGNGVPIRLTQAGNIVGTAGSISGLVSPATASYQAGPETFVWQSNVNKPANMDMGYIILRNNSVSSNGLTISPPLAMGASYAITLPSLPVSGTSLATLNSAGAMGTVAPDGSTIVISGGLLEVPDGGITPEKLSALGEQISSSSGVFGTTSGSYVDVTNLTVTITTTGRPVALALIPDGTTNLSTMQLAINAGSQTSMIAESKILRDASSIAFHTMRMDGASASLIMGVPPGAFNYVDVVAAGTYVYKVQTRVTTTATTVNFNYIKLIAYEL